VILLFSQVVRNSKIFRQIYYLPSLLVVNKYGRTKPLRLISCVIITGSLALTAYGKDKRVEG
jgi:hypothetical protein